MRTILAAGLVLAAILGAGHTALGETKPKAPAKAPGAPPVKVALGIVHDRRSDGAYFKKLEIGLKLPDIPAADVAAVRTVVTAATDDTGRNLVPEDAGQGDLQSTGRGSAPERTEPAEVVVELKNPARKATKVASVAGEIELYLPGRDPAAVATIPKVAGRADGKPINDPSLKANGVMVAVLGKAQFEAEKKRQLEAVKAAARQEKVSGEELEGRIADFEMGFVQPEEGALVLKITAPEGLIQEMVYVDGAGEEKFASASQESGLTVLTTWGETPGPDWGLRIRMKTPKTLVRHSFALKDVPLP